MCIYKLLFHIVEIYIPSSANIATTIVKMLEGKLKLFFKIFLKVSYQLLTHL